MMLPKQCSNMLKEKQANDLFETFQITFGKGEKKRE